MKNLKILLTKRRYQSLAIATAVAISPLTCACSLDHKSVNGNTVPSYGRYEDWRPTTIIERVHYSDEEMHQFWLARVESDRGDFDVDKNVPIPEMVRWLEPSESLEPVAKCMRDAGYDTTVDPTGFALDSTDVPGHDLQMWKCYAMYPSLVRALPRSDDVDRVIYEYDVEYFIPCAQAHGVKFVTEIPPKEIYIQAQTNPEAYPDFDGWVPHFMWGSDWDNHSFGYFTEHPDEAAQLYKDCPPFPPSQYLRINE